MRHHAVRSGLAALLSVTLVAGLSPVTALALGPSTQNEAQPEMALTLAPQDVVRDLSDYDIYIELSADSFDYQEGVVQKPTVERVYAEVYDDVEETYIESDIDAADYEVTYVNSDDDDAEECDPVDLGTYYVRITGKNNWTGTLYKSFKIIDPYDVANLWNLYLDSRELNYVEGELVAPTFTVEDSNDEVVPRNAYDVQVMREVYDEDTGEYIYEEVAAGDQMAGEDYYLRITPVGGSDYHGYVQRSFTVVDPYDVANSWHLDLDSSEVGYVEGELVYPSFTLVDSDGETVPEGDYAVKVMREVWDDDAGENVYEEVAAGEQTGGTYYLRIVPAEGSEYHGFLQQWFDVNDPYDISNLWSISLDSEQVDYVEGKLVYPEFTLVNSDGETVPEDDYAVKVMRDVYDEDAGEYVDVEVAPGEQVAGGSYSLCIVPAEGSGYRGELNSDDFTVFDPTDLGCATIDYNPIYLKAGQTATPEFKVELDDVVLKQGTDYTVAYYVNEDGMPGDEVKAPLGIGEYIVVLKGAGSYKGVNEESFSIQDISDLSTAKFSTIRRVYPYTGKPVVVEPTVTAADGTLLELGVDYKLEFAKCAHDRDTFEIIEGTETSQAPTEPISSDEAEEYGAAAVDYVVYAVGIGEYHGTTLQTFPGGGHGHPIWDSIFEIVAANDLKGAVLTYDEEIAYTGKRAVPALTVTMDTADGTATLVEGRDYTVSYSDDNGDEVDDPTEVGSYTGSIEPTDEGGYINERTFYFDIRTDISKAQVIVADQQFTGKALEPAVTVTLDGKVVPADQYTVAYSNNIDPGTATVTVKAGHAITGGPSSEEDLYYMGTATGTFLIKGGSLADATVSGIAAATYTGKAITQPALAVELNGKKLVAGTDYDVAYANNVNAGTAKITLTGKGALAGTQKVVTFAIDKAKIAIPTAKKGLVYTGKKQTGVAAGTGYTVKGGSATNAGNYAATATTDANHVFTNGSATASVKWSIGKAANVFKAKVVKKTQKAKYSEKKATTIKAKKAFKVTKNTSKGKVTYKLTNLSGKKSLLKKAKKNIKVSSKGKITIKKGTPKGTYTLKVKLSTKATANYKSASKTVTLKIKVAK